MRKPIKPSDAWDRYCRERQLLGKCELIQCLLCYLKGKVCKDKWMDKNCVCNIDIQNIIYNHEGGVYDRDKIISELKKLIKRGKK